MAYTTKVITDTSPDFDSNPKTITEDGFPYSVEIGNLDANTGYYTKAEIWQDGTLNDTSEVETFQTLKAGSITLTFGSTVRNGDDYVVTYTVSSTYALSSAILTTNNTNFQGVISGNTIVFTVSGLTQDNTYLYNITAIDIYAETGTADGRITTEHDYSKDYFTIKNVSNNSNTITLRAYGQNHSRLISVSNNNGSNWTEYQVSAGSPVNIAVLVAGDSIILKSSIGTGINGKYIEISSSENIEVYGNIFSLYGGYPHTPSKNVNNFAFNHLFYQCNKLVSAENLCLGIGTVSAGLYDGTFQDCTSLVTPPNMYGISVVDEYGLSNMFKNCTSLVTPPDLSSVKLVYQTGMQNMFYDCNSLTTMPDLSNVITVGDYGMENIFYNCDSLVNVSDFDSLTRVDDYGFRNAFSFCKSLETAPNFNSVTTVGVRAFGMLFSDDKNLKSAAGFDSLTTVSANTFSSAYQNCTSLKTGSDIRRITAAGRYAFNGMYKGCSSLLEAYAPTITWDTSKTDNWLSGVYSTGELYADPSIASSIPTSDASGCPTGWTVKTA